MAHSPTQCSIQNYIPVFFIGPSNTKDTVKSTKTYLENHLTGGAGSKLCKRTLIWAAELARAKLSFWKGWGDGKIKSCKKNKKSLDIFKKQWWEDILMQKVKRLWDILKTQGPLVPEGGYGHMICTLYN